MKWISVEESLPDVRYKPVLVASSAWHDGVGVAYLGVNIWFTFHGITIEPTHWMPLPESPEADYK